MHGILVSVSSSDAPKNMRCDEYKPHVIPKRTPLYRVGVLNDKGTTIMLVCPKCAHNRILQGISSHTRFLGHMNDMLIETSQKHRYPDLKTKPVQVHRRKYREEEE